MRAVLLAILLLAGVAFSQEAPFTRDCVAMMPGLTNQQRNRLRSTQTAAAREASKARVELANIEKKLRAKPKREEAAKLKKRRAELRKKVPAVWAKLEQQALQAGLDASQLARLKAMPRGPLREYRYNHGVVLEAPNLSAAQQAMLHHLVAATDAAQGAGLVLQDHLKKGVKDKVQRRLVDSACNAQRRDIEKRFWRAAYYALTPQQMRETRELFSPRYRNIPDLRRQLYLLPAVSPSQGTRIAALYAEHDSERAADLAEVRRISMALKSKDLPKPERSALYKTNGECYARIREVDGRFYDGIRDTLTPMQRKSLDSLPPTLNSGERSRAPWEVTRSMRLRPEQQARIRQLQKQYNQARKEIEKQRRAGMGDLQGAGLGPESPQSMMMEMVQQGARSRTLGEFRHLGHLLFVEILDPEQVAAWVVAPSLEPASTR